MTHHTPGPWTVNDAEGLWIAPADENANVICDIVGRLQRDALPGGYTAEDDANARLIAAAPDLLNALKEAVGWLVEAAASKKGRPKNGPIKWAGMASRAIAKAEGR